ncbi:putative cation-transporting P-type ATPase, P-type ATPase, transmembrane domain superfamily [Helianthus annuus]|nr:putative cation-transporting P-type ATPase, P-type ATPase, transmembrane domain superfamily [Helianthus annuus]
MAVQLLWVSMIMNTFGALALAIEPPNNELMERAPVGRNRNFTISNVMWRNISGQALYQFAVIGLLQLKGKSFFSLDGGNSDLILNTLIFNSFVFCQVTSFKMLTIGVNLYHDTTLTKNSWVWVYFRLNQKTRLTHVFRFA